MASFAKNFEYKSLKAKWSCFATFALVISLLPAALWPCVVFAEDPGQAIYDKAIWAFEHAQDVHYAHRKRPAAEQVTELADGRLQSINDCSGFISWLLQGTSSQHYSSIAELQKERPYPQVKTYADFFASLQPGQASGGWLRLADVNELKRGDIIAWQKDASADGSLKKGNTGHIAVVCQKPGAVFEESIQGKKYRLVSIAVIDSSSVYHFPPESVPPNSGQLKRDGLGKGEIRLALDEAGAAIAYWEGSFWQEGGKELIAPSACSHIYFVRPVSLSY